MMAPGWGPTGADPRVNQSMEEDASGPWNLLREAVASGLLGQWEAGSPVMVLQAGGLLAHVLAEQTRVGWMVEEATRHAPPLAEGCAADVSEGCHAAACTLVALLQGGAALERPTLRVAVVEPDGVPHIMVRCLLSRAGLSHAPRVDNAHAVTGVVGGRADLVVVVERDGERAWRAVQALHGQGVSRVLVVAADAPRGALVPPSTVWMSPALDSNGLLDGLRRCLAGVDGLPQALR